MVGLEWNLNLTEEQIEQLNEVSKYGIRYKQDVNYCTSCLEAAMKKYKKDKVKNETN